MPPLPGEERLTTVYADIHYYFARPAVRPTLHRFDKASYFYIYHNSTRRTSRIEIANCPGTPDQDAFQGSLESCRIINSHNFPTRVTLEVGPAAATSSTASPQPGRDAEEWLLASADPRDVGKPKHRLHTLDIYFWAAEDASLVINTFKRLLQPSQLDIVEAPETRTKQQDVISPVVQNLENVAISDPAYQNGRTRNSQNQPEQKPANLPPPPPLPAQGSQPAQHPSASMSPVSAVSSSDIKHPTKLQEPAPTFAPMAYNPAAPAAPEPIAHREDTPPPPDAADGTGLAAATVHDNAYNQHQPSLPWTGVPGPQPSAYSHYGSLPPGPPPYGSPPQAQSHPQTQTQTPGAPQTFAGPPTAVKAPEGRHPSIAAQHYVPSQATDPNAQLYAQQPVQTPGAQFYSTVNDGHPHKPLQHVQPQYADYLAAGRQSTSPPGGYSQYQYGQPVQQAGSPYDVHSQVYRPTEAEANPHHRKPSKSDSGRRPSKFDERAERVEKGVGRLFKKIEKKIG